MRAVLQEVTCGSQRPVPGEVLERVRQGQSSLYPSRTGPLHLLFQTFSKRLGTRTTIQPQVAMARASPKVFACGSALRAVGEGAQECWPRGALRRCIESGRLTRPDHYATLEPDECLALYMTQTMRRSLILRQIEQDKPEAV